MRADKGNWNMRGGLAIWSLLLTACGSAVHPGQGSPDGDAGDARDASLDRGQDTAKDLATGDVTAGDVTADVGTDVPPHTPATSIATDALDFGPITCGSAGGTKVLSFENTGDATLHFQGSIGQNTIFAIEGAASDGTLSGNVAPGSSAMLTVVTRAVPTTTGAGAVLDGVLTITTNAPDAASAQIPLIAIADGSTCTLVCGAFAKCTPSGGVPYCANTMTDNANCGTCGNACGIGQVCGGGTCALTCGALTKCSPSIGAPYCANTTTDSANCGTCGNVCGTGQVCVAGTCALTCGALTKCSVSGGADYCANTMTDGANCGTCGNACGTGQVCGGGTCALTCGALTKCSPSIGAPYCANTTTDGANCGTCGNACGTGQVCGGGTCALTCGALTKCSPSIGAPYCANTATDNANCGTCGNACGAGHVCSNGACTLTCGPLTKCSPSVGSPYCANIATDNVNCGACGNTCPAGEVCSNGACILTCGALTKCSPSMGAPYCANTATDNANCGTCGNACGSGQVCSSGACTLTCGALTKCTPSVGAPYCANTATDNANCSACGVACPAGQACVTGACNPTCSASETICGGMCTNTSFDPSNCASCNHACSFPQGSSACSSGVCYLASCDAGYLNCNAIQSDGCEANKNTSTAHCGACGHACALGETCNSGVCTANLSQGLLGYWNMDDAPGSTTAVDSSTNHLDGVVQGPVTFVAGAGKQGSGAMTVGGAGFIRVVFPNNVKNQGSGPAIPLGNITFAMWFKTSAATLGAVQVVEGGTLGGGGCDRIIGNGGGNTFNYNAWSEVNMSGGAVVNDGAWHHLAYVLDKTNGLRAYIDGVLDISSTTPTGNCGVGCSGFDWASEYWIGRGGGCRYGADYFVGTIDDVRIYDHVLSPSAVLQLFSTTQ